MGDVKATYILYWGIKVDFQAASAICNRLRRFVDLLNKDLHNCYNLHFSFATLLVLTVLNIGSCYGRQSFERKFAIGILFLYPFTFLQIRKFYRVAQKFIDLNRMNYWHFVQMHLHSVQCIVYFLFVLVFQFFGMCKEEKINVSLEVQLFGYLCANCYVLLMRYCHT